MFHRNNSQDVDWIWLNGGTGQKPNTAKDQNKIDAGKDLLDSIKSQYLQLAEWECQALADEARAESKFNPVTGPDNSSKARKVVFNSREDVWDFRSDINIPWLSDKCQDKNKTEKCELLSLRTQDNNTTQLQTSFLNSHKATTSSFHNNNFRNEFV